MSNYHLPPSIRVIFGIAIYTEHTLKKYLTHQKQKMMNMNRKVTLVLLIVSCFLTCGSFAQDTLVPAIMTFGDSAVDVGNNDYLPTLFKADYPPYGRDFANKQPTGRFCNGKLATDFTGKYCIKLIRFCVYSCVLYYMVFHASSLKSQCWFNLTADSPILSAIRLIQ